MEYIIVFQLADGKIKTEYIKAQTAQNAVDKIKADYDIEKIRLVAKTIKGWR